MGGCGMPMAQTWVVDSNCFIHLGSMAPDSFAKDLGKILSQDGMYVTPGVHEEVRSVRFQRWKKQPNLLSILKPLLTTITIDDSQIRGLAAQIGERASPQDVDLSLMVLASKLSKEGREVILVTDDFKMTTTSQKVNLGFSTCPPSTFIQRLAQIGPKQSRSGLNSLSRRVRAAEMRYAISRAGEYDIQAKLTWMVDSLLDSKEQVTTVPQSTSEQTSNQKSIRALRKHLLGGVVKNTHMKSLGSLTEICEPIKEFDLFISSISQKQDSSDVMDIYNIGIEEMCQVLESIGLGLAPLDESSAEIAHRAMAGHVYRMESALGMLAKISGQLNLARLHLSRALQSATLIDDRGAEMRAMHQLGLLALVRGKWARAASLFETANRQAQVIKEECLQYVVCAGIMRHMDGDLESANSHIDIARSLISDDKKKAAGILSNLGENLLAIDEAGLAIEVLDEAMECAIEVDDLEIMQSLAESMVLANSALTDKESQQNESLREYLDGLNNLDTSSSEAFEKQISNIEKQAEELAKPLDETWKEWQPASKLFPNNSQLTVMRLEVDNDGQSLVVCHQPELGMIGFWMPEGDLNISPGHKLSVGDSRVKVAVAPEFLREQHSIRALVALEKPEHISFSAEIDL
jgi:rRNA maturation endonuclease Nob1/tetratricopeptide (TPR) repeat protein